MCVGLPGQLTCIHSSDDLEPAAPVLPKAESLARQLAKTLSLRFLLTHLRRETASYKETGTTGDTIFGFFCVSLCHGYRKGKRKIGGGTEKGQNLLKGNTRQCWMSLYHFVVL